MDKQKCELEANFDSKLLKMEESHSEKIHKLQSTLDVFMEYVDSIMESRREIISLISRRRVERLREEKVEKRRLQNEREQ